MLVPRFIEEGLLFSVACVRVSGLLPDNRPSDFSQILQLVVFSYLVVHCKKFFSEKGMDGSNVIKQKVSLLATLGHFEAFLAIKEPLGMQQEIFSKIR